ncbi:phosphotransferase [Paenibacillus sp. JTLBN-2024]
MSHGSSSFVISNRKQSCCGHKKLQGGVSAQVTKLEIELPEGVVRKLLARRHGEADRSRNPHIAREEYKLLQQLTAAGLPVPKPHAVLSSFGDAPLIVTEFVEGESILSLDQIPDAEQQLADRLSDIHRLPWERYELRFLPKQGDRCSAKLKNRPGQLDDSLWEGRIRDKLESVWPLKHTNNEALLHGDFWPGNVIWKDGSIAAVIDWEDAALGDPLFDLANARLELLWASGIRAMEKFTERYQTRNPHLDYAGLPAGFIRCAETRLGVIRLGACTRRREANARKAPPVCRTSFGKDFGLKEMH